MNVLVGLGGILVAVPAILFLYAYVVYPASLLLLARVLRSETASVPPSEWPGVSIVVPAFNEEKRIASILEDLLALDYPAERKRIVVVSDASTDATDAIAASYAERGVELHRLPERRGKTAAENAAAAWVDGEIVVNTDASVRIPPTTLKPLIAAFVDPDVGVASGRDVSVGTGDPAGRHNRAEAQYVGYEMTVRRLETRAGGIVGASGCLFAMRRTLHALEFPRHLSRDFASCLVARESGYRAVSVDEAYCFVPRTTSLDREYRRKVRTMARGLATLAYMRPLLNPFRHGLFAWKLASHKLARWLVPPSLLLVPAGLATMALGGAESAAWGLSVVIAGGLVGAGAWHWSRAGRPPRAVTTLGWAFGVNLAALAAWSRFLRGDAEATWEPTRR